MDPSHPCPDGRNPLVEVGMDALTGILWALGPPGMTRLAGASKSMCALVTEHPFTEWLCEDIGLPTLPSLVHAIRMGRAITESEAAEAPESFFCIPFWGPKYTYIHAALTQESIPSIAAELSTRFTDTEHVTMHIAFCRLHQWWPSDMERPEHHEHSVRAALRAPEGEPSPFADFPRGKSIAVVGWSDFEDHVSRVLTRHPPDEYVGRTSEQWSHFACNLKGFLGIDMLDDDDDVELYREEGLALAGDRVAFVYYIVVAPIHRMWAFHVHY